MFCPNCGTKADGGNFCSNCGTALPVDTQTEQTTNEQPYDYAYTEIDTFSNGESLDVFPLFIKYSGSKMGFGKKNSLSAEIQKTTHIGIWESVKYVDQKLKDKDFTARLDDYQYKLDEAQKKAEEKLNEQLANRVIHCPKCFSTYLRTDNKGFSFGKAIVGSIVLGPLGILAGGLGMKNARVVCNKCGHKFKYEDAK